jgi:hypothetical protein
MTYATVMVSLALNRSNAARLEIAGQLVKRFNACAIGTAAGEFSPPLYFTTGEQVQKVLDQVRPRSEIASPRSKRSFARRCRIGRRQWNGAAPRIFRLDLPSSKLAPPTSLLSEWAVAKRSPIPSRRPVRTIS